MWTFMKSGNERTSDSQIGKYAPVILHVVVSKVADVSGQLQLIAVRSSFVYLNSGHVVLHSLIFCNVLLLQMCIFIGTLADVLLCWPYLHLNYILLYFCYLLVALKGEIKSLLLLAPVSEEDILKGKQPIRGQALGNQNSESETLLDGEDDTLSSLDEKDLDNLTGKEMVHRLHPPLTTTTTTTSPCPASPDKIKGMEASDSHRCR